HLVVAEAGDAVLSAVIGARAGLVVGQVVPRVALLAHVLSDGPPLAFAQVGSPLFPRHALVAGFGESVALFRLAFHELQGAPSCEPRKPRARSLAADATKVRRFDRTLDPARAPPTPTEEACPELNQGSFPPF